jgi:hypothetical protein
MLISKIWNNYGGAEDGLNQGISILRKALVDTNKQIIETIPKKGYILHASVKYNVEKTDAKKEKASKKRPFILAKIFGIFILITLFLFRSGKNKISNKLEKQPSSFSQSDSIVSKNWRGKNYKLLFDRNKKMILFENSIQIADSNLINYEIVIQELKDKLANQQDTNR